MRPIPPAFEDRPTSSVGGIARFDVSGAIRRDAFVRRTVLVIGLAIALLAAILLMSRC
jgi:hypothetical protein